MPDPDEVKDQDEEELEDETPEEESLEGQDETPEQEAEGEEPAEIVNVARVEEPTKSRQEALQWQEELKSVNERLLHLESENEALRGQLKKRNSKPKKEPEELPQNLKKPYRRKRSIFPRSQAMK